MCTSYIIQEKKIVMQITMVYHSTGDSFHTLVQNDSW